MFCNDVCMYLMYLYVSMAEALLVGISCKVQNQQNRKETKNKKYLAK